MQSISKIKFPSGDECNIKYEATNIATFEKVSLEEYINARKNQDVYVKEDVIVREWNSIKLPERQTSSSAGYDFYSPYNVDMNDLPKTIVTGIRAKIDPSYFLMIVPRSSLGFKYGMHLQNTVGIIDSDYYNAQNEGHIMIKCSSDCNFYINEGDRFAQGIFIPYGISSNGNKNNDRVGGIGSTDK